MEQHCFGGGGEKDRLSSRKGIKLMYNRIEKVNVSTILSQIVRSVIREISLM